MIDFFLAREKDRDFYGLDHDHDRSPTINHTFFNVRPGKGLTCSGLLAGERRRNE